jgi:Zn-dependent M28 family amino/carboxypeptidase
MRLTRLILCGMLVIPLGLSFAFVSAQEASSQGATEQAANVADVLSRIRPEILHGHIQFLADDLLEGRGPGSTGDAITQLYLETQFKIHGLQPIPGSGEYRQTVPMLGMSSQPEATWRFRSTDSAKKDIALELKYFDDYIAVAGKPEKKIVLEDRELVFVGYGIQAPEYQWDDFKGVDLRGKILVMMNNDPERDPDLFAGSRRLYYGRWDYKYESAARQGAAGAIIIHTTPSAGYPFTVIQTSWTGEQFELRDSTEPRIDMKAWVTDDAARSIVALAGKDLDELREAAESRDFKPVPLGLTLTTHIQAETRERITANVIGFLPGSDPTVADEYVIFMAHHDHIGIAVDRDENGDNIYNGAVDNASGTASLLAILQAITSSNTRPKRSLMFAAVGAEEQGLLGSKYLAENPVVPNGKLAALVNMDGINFLGPTRDVQVIGLGKSSMDALVEAAASKQNRRVVGDLEPSKGYYYRSDQFSLAKVGVPAVYLHAGHAVRGKPDGWGKEQLQAWTDKHYHQRSDEYDPQWDLSGAVEDTRLLTEVGLAAANAQEMQAWIPGDEFEAARKQAIQAAKSAARR